MYGVEKRDAQCGVTCMLNEDPLVDHCASCRVEEGIGPYGHRRQAQSIEQSNFPQIKKVMTDLKYLLGERSYNLLYSLLDKVDNDFHELVFADNWSVDNIEESHNVAQAMKLSMQMIE
jgi:hypothetical protein